MSGPRILIAFFVFAATLLAGISPEAGSFYFQEYLPKVYGANPQNWAVVQDQRGIMYFGNTDGILEYDGASWRKIALPNLSMVRSLAVDSKGTVYVGGQGEIGFLEPDSSGTLRYVSLLDRVSAQDRHFGNVWSVCVTKSGVLFSSSERIFRWSPDHRMKTWKPSSAFAKIYLAGGVPYFAIPGSGLYSIQGDSLVPVEGGEVFANTTVRGVFRFAGSLVVATSDKLYRAERNKFERLATGADGILRDTQIYTCRTLNDGSLAIGSVGGGLILLDSTGGFERVINKDTGLDSNAVNAIYSDRQGGLWLALARGIVRLDIGIPLTHFGDREGLGEIVLAIQRQGESLYAGTTVGLSRLVPAHGSTAAKFEPVAGIHGQVNVLLATPRSLLAGGQFGLYEVIGNQSWPVLPKTGAVYDLAHSISDPAILYVAGRFGLFILRREEGYWKQVREVPANGPDFRTVVEDSNGRVWVTTRSDIRRFDLTSDQVGTERFTSAQGVPGGWKFVFQVRKSVIFGTTKGLLRFDEAKKSFVPDSRFGEMFSDGSRGVLFIQESPSGDVWLAGERYHGILNRNRSGGYTWNENPLVRSGIKELYAFYVDTDNIAWASGMDGGLVRYRPPVSAPSNVDFSVLLRRVQTLETNQDVFGGTGKLSRALRFRHQQNALRFEFAAPDFEDESRTDYQVFLEGVDKKWSDWTAEARKEYTNLFEGSYLFRVRARDLHGRISTEETFGFRVLPPWYRTWWAYLIYALLCCGAVWLLVKWRLHALAEKNRRLEGIIMDRTAEIRKQRDAIQAEEEKTEALLLNILPSRVADELRTTGQVEPLSYEDITVCFTDFVGFTLSSEKLPAADLVAALHQYFTAFDEIVGRYGLEKLKTIGDSYMFVSGLPDRKRSHAVDAVLAALEIVDAVERLSQSGPGWSVRIGLHSGPVVAGVVGVRKFAFDIWGETVNFASRFESSGWPNRVNLSARTYDLVRDFVDCIPRGPVRIKEGRELEMYFARYVRKELLNGSGGSSVSFAELYEKRFGHPPPSFPSLAVEETAETK